jgi:DAK2 domain fusion protein YloV
LATGDDAVLTTKRARDVVTAAFQALEDRKKDINNLNVYPVPDGDTGTNLALTVRGVLDDLGRLPEDADPGQISTSISESALMSARGNSGVILSQIVRGAMEVLAEGDALSRPVVTAALDRATEASYRAVRKPVEGTMLTVLREVAEAAEAFPGNAEEEGEGPFFQWLIEVGWDSVRRTPLLLKVLADAGVVDAGGYGLMVLFEGMVSGAGEFHRLAAVSGPDDLAVLPSRVEAFEKAVSPYTYCTSFLLAGSDLDAKELEHVLSQYGDSLLVVGDRTQLKVHVHTDEPGTVLGLATMRGTLHSVEIDNMKEQTAERDRRLREEEGASGGSTYSGSEDALTEVVAVVSGEGNKKLFRSMGATLLVEGGQTMNPSAEQLLQAAKSAHAPTVVILPNNKNIVMTAEQIVGLADKEILVVPTRSMQAGLSAMVAFDPLRSGVENQKEMQAAYAHLITGEVTKAVRDSNLNGLQIKQGTFIGIVNEQVISTAPDFQEVVDAVAHQLIDDDREVVTLLLGNGEGAAFAAEAARRLKERYPEVDLEVHEGGQPLYPLLLSAE